uniref:Uncharacterized protein n=1 Tax=Avena sativa TaxID=4498 RepID=A0ACD5WAK2_AVESA
MAPSASMLFLSYHQLHHHGPAVAPEAEPDAPREGGAGAGGFRFSFRNVFSSAALTPQPRRDAAPEARQRGLRAGGDQEEKAAAAAALGSKFEEAVELSCWSS